MKVYVVTANRVDPEDSSKESEIVGVFGTEKLARAYVWGWRARVASAVVTRDQFYVEFKRFKGEFKRTQQNEFMTREDERRLIAEARRTVGLTGEIWDLVTNGPFTEDPVEFEVQT